jgi:hypothetical protein
MPSDPTADHFARVVAAFDGARFALDDGASKMLFAMLDRPEGCDASIRPDGFEARYGWHPSRHRYYLSIGPAVVSTLLDLARAVEGSSEVQAVIGPAALAALEGPRWSFEARRVWLARSSSSVTIAVRRAEAGDARAPVPWPEPIDYPPPSFVELSNAQFCPACGALGSRFRELMDGFLVCSACGGSFQVPR